MNIVTKTANESLVLRTDFVRMMEERWLPGTSYSSTASTFKYVRPTAPNGYEYQCTTSGQSGSNEPDWPKSVGGTVTDGSVTWTGIAFGTNATDTISTASVSADTGITTDSGTIDGSAVNTRVSGGTAGQEYDVTVQVVTADGNTLEIVVRVVVI